MSIHNFFFLCFVFFIFFISTTFFPFFLLLLDVVAKTTTDDKKGVDRSSTVIARDGTEGRLNAIHPLNSTSFY